MNPLIATHNHGDYNSPPVPEVHYASPGPERGKIRSKFPEVIAEAMAAQWGDGELPDFKEGLFSSTLATDGIEIT